MIFAVYLGHESFHPVAVLRFSRNQFQGEVLNSQIEGYYYKKKGCTSIVSTRPTSTIEMTELAYIAW